MLDVEGLDRGGPPHDERVILDRKLDLDRPSTTVLDEGEQHFTDSNLDVVDLVDREAGHRRNTAGCQAQDSRKRWVGGQTQHHRAHDGGVSHCWSRSRNGWWSP